MTAPTIELTVTQRYALKDLAWEKSQAVTPGRVMLCKGRKIVGYCDVADLAHGSAIAARCNTVCLSASDYDDVQAWLKGAAA
ncbi:MAG TPA: hypothetical protein VH020_16605 [Stellaceae bacterium]|jgi:hypothetical protein|nr:hypothetical protein [Stellaceae bacterium]